MKKIEYYFQKIDHYLKLWRDHLPITNIALFVIVTILTGIVVFISIFPESGLSRRKNSNAKFDEFEKVILPQQVDFPSSDKFNLVGNNNLFRPEREEWPDPPPPPPLPSLPKPKPAPVAPKVAAPPPKPRISTKKIKLFAILMFGESRVAMIENLEKSKSKDVYVYLKVGDDVLGYTVKKIEPNVLTVEWNGQEFEIKLYET